MIDRAVAIYEHIPWFLLPLDVQRRRSSSGGDGDGDSSGDGDPVVSSLRALRGRTVTVDQLRWMLLVATLSDLDMNLEFVVKAVIAAPDGKWSEELGGVMLIESQFVEHYVRRQLGPQLDRVVMVLQSINYLVQHFEAERAASIEGAAEALITASMAIEEEHRAHPAKYQRISALLSRFEINHFAQFTILNAAQRLSIYQRNYQDIGTLLCRLGSRMMDALQSLDLTVAAPILSTMEILSFIKLLLNSLMTSMSSIVAVLSSIIIYCLMIIDVENGVYESGVLRSIGMRKSSLIWILNMKSLLFCIPGIAGGLILSHLLHIFAADAIAEYVSVPPHYLLSFASMAVASFFFGLSIPLLSGIVPLRKALSATLSSSLNNVLTGDSVIVNVIHRNSSKYGFNAATTAMATLLITISFVCLYLIPYFVVSGNFPAFFTVFDLIFLGLLFGEGILALLVQNRLDHLICSALMGWGPQKKLRFLVHKNLNAHKRRNNKTGIMIILSSAFIVFNGCMVVLQRSNFNTLFTVLSGADIVFHSMSHSKPLPEREIRGLLDANKALSVSPQFGARRRIVEDYTFKTWTIELQTDSAGKVVGGDRFTFGPLGRDFATTVANRLVGVEENYCSVAYCAEFLVVTDTAESVSSDPAFPTLSDRPGVPDPVKGLYYRYNQSLRASPAPDIAVPPEGVLSGHFRSRHDERAMEISKRALNETYGTRINLVMATAMKSACGVDSEMALKVNARYHRNSAHFHVVRFAASPVIASKLPGFYFSAHSQVAPMMTALASLPEFDYLLETVRNHSSGGERARDGEFPFHLKKQQLLIRMKNGSLQQDRTEIVDAVSALCDTDYILITDTKKTIEGVVKTTNLLSIFFSAVAVLTMFLCFFISFISFRQNVNENVYQFGVLRSIGISSLSIVCLFVFESITITLSSLALGTAIGITQSVLITLQSQILTENIFEFEFPLRLYLVLVGASTAIAVASSIIPSIKLMQTAPAQVLRL